MIATLQMHDLSRQKSYEPALPTELTQNHTVGQAIELFREAHQLPDSGLRWQAFSRGIKLDAKATIGDLEETDTSWTVMPEVSAAAAGPGR